MTLLYIRLLSTRKYDYHISYLEILHFHLFDVILQYEFWRSSNFDKREAIVQDY